MTIPVTVIIVTKNAGGTIANTLEALNEFNEVLVVDSMSEDNTRTIVSGKNVPLIDFHWNGQYPKKRQWCLENIATQHEWIFFVDGDEIVTPALASEIAKAVKNSNHAAWFVRGQPVFCGRKLKYGRWNNKIALFKKQAVSYPEFPDLKVEGMGEIEGHYQPKVTGTIGQLEAPLIHDCAETIDAWIDRHQRYAAWQAKMEFHGINLAVTETGMRALTKRAFQDSFGRAVVTFLDSYILQKGFLDGMPGLHYAVARGWYYWLISARKSVLANKQKAAASSQNA